MVPLVLDMRGKRVVIFGGGAVGARKARYFSGEADLLIVSRTFSKELEGTRAERICMDLSVASMEEIEELIDGATLVIAATSDRGINDRIGSICRSRRILFNNADGKRGDVILPAVSRGKNYLLAVTTFGKSPAFAHYLKTMLEARNPEFDSMISLQERLRTILKEREPDAGERARILHQVISDADIWAALGEGLERAVELAERRYLHGSEP